MLIWKTRDLIEMPFSNFDFILDRKASLKTGEKMKHPIRKTKWLTAIALTAIIGVFTGCSDSGTNVPDCDTIANAPTLSTDWVSFVNWDNAERITIVANEHSETSYDFTPDHLEFVAGKPYILVLQTPAGNQEKHYFHAPEFFKAIATRKAQTADGEYKAPYFDDFELLTGANELELYFVPVIEGEYELICTIEGHETLGMVGEIHITCGTGLALDLQVDPNFNSALLTDPRRSGSHAVWASAQTITIDMVETSQTEFSFSPDTLTVDAGSAYVLQITNPSANSSKHYFTAPEFFQTLVTRKAQDGNAEIKVPYFKAVELLIGGTMELYIVPTVPGTYDFVCTITGHEEAGMVGTIIVQ